jgi:ERCC4-related helicase
MKDRQLKCFARPFNQNSQQRKVLVFTQFADTAYYLTEQFKKRGITQIESVTGE